MSRIAWIDASVGIAGDMLLAALIDAGASVEVVRAGLKQLNLAGWSMQPTEVQRGAFRATYLNVQIDGTQPDPHAGPVDGVPRPTTPSQGASTGHVHADHTHSHAQIPAGDHAHAHRPYSDVRRILTTANLPKRVAERALAVYERLATAEARMHGMAIEDVVLHEVGAVDAILDIVGCCLALEDLRIDRIVATPLPMGTGSVQSAHGIIPLPAPATLSICQGYPIVTSRWPGEWVTPTGAALVCTLASPGGVPAMTIEGTGYGAGGRNPPMVANLVRVVIGQEAAATTDAVIEVACTVDDMLGEHIPALIQRLLDAGAVDAWLVPVLMKKGRPGYTVHALAKESDTQAVSEAMLRHSSTLGVRQTRHERRILDRWFETVQTPYGEVRMKVGGRSGEAWHASPEHADVATLAKQAGVAEREVFDAATASWRMRLPV